MKAVSFRKRIWREGKKLVIAIPRCLWGEEGIGAGKLVRVTIEPLEEGDGDE